MSETQPAPQSPLPRFVVFSLDDHEDAWEGWSAEEQQAVYDADMRFGALLAERGGQVVGGSDLTHSRETVVLAHRPGAAPLITDGPFAETTEQLTGFLIVEAPDLATVVETAAAMAEGHTRLMIRPVPDHSQDGTDGDGGTDGGAA